MTDINKPFHHQPGVHSPKPVGDQSGNQAEQAAKGENTAADQHIERHLLSPDTVLAHLNTMGPSTVLSARTADLLSNLDPAEVDRFESDLLAKGGEFSSLFGRLSELGQAMVIADLFLAQKGVTPVIELTV